MLTMSPGASLKSSSERSVLPSDVFCPLPLSRETVFSGPHHPYTESLLSAVPTIDGGGRDRIKLQGEIPSAASPPSGCVFHTRCHRKLGPICEEQEPPLIDAVPGERKAVSEERQIYAENAVIR